MRIEDITLDKSTECRRKEISGNKKKKALQKKPNIALRSGCEHGNREMSERRWGKGLVNAKTIFAKTLAGRMGLSRRDLKIGEGAQGGGRNENNKQVR